MEYLMPWEKNGCTVLNLLLTRSTESCSLCSAVQKQIHRQRV